MTIKGDEHYHKLVLKDKVRRTKDNNPCDNCIELECENHGAVCPFYEKKTEEKEGKEE